MEKNDSFRLLDSEVAGAIIGAAVGALVAWDLVTHFLEWLAR